MEVNDVLIALENLKRELENVKRAKESVENAVAAANKVCHGFGECNESFRAAGESMSVLTEKVASVQDRFNAGIVLPLEEKVAEIVRVSDGMKESSGDLVQTFSKKCDGIAADFRNVVKGAEKDIGVSIGEFHKELESFGGKISRMTERLEGAMEDVSKKIEEHETFVKFELLKEIFKGQDGVARKAEAAISEAKEALEKSDERIQGAVGEANKATEASREKICGKLDEVSDEQSIKIGSLKRMTLVLLVIMMVMGVTTLASVGVVIYTQLMVK